MVSVPYTEMDLSSFQSIFGSKTLSPLEEGTTAAPNVAESKSTKKGRQQTGQIAVDIFELENYYIIRAPIAGVKLSDIDIEVDDKVITIRGTRSVAEDIPADQFYVQECFWGNFERSITLPVSIDPKKVKATFSKDSILKVIVPKEEKVKIVRISEG